MNSDSASSWEKDRTLADGTRVTIRPLRHDDKEDLRRAILSLSEETTMRRFLRPHVEPSPAVLDHLIDTDGKDRVAIVAIVASPDLKEEHGVAVARYTRLASEPDVAEAAITVLDAYQRRGLGSVMLRELGEIALRNGVKNFRAEILAENAAISAILNAVGATKIATTDTTATYDVNLRP